MSVISLLRNKGDLQFSTLGYLLITLFGLAILLFIIAQISGRGIDLADFIAKILPF